MWLASVALAQDLAGPDPVGFAPAPLAGVDAPLRVLRAEPLPAPVGAVVGAGSTDAPDAAAGSAFLSWRAPIHPDASVGVVAAAHAGGGAAGLGGARLTAVVRHGEVRGVTLGTAPFFEVPVGAPAWRGGAAGGARLLAGADLRGLRVDANLGLRIAPRGTAEGVATGSAALLGLAAALPVGPVSVVLEHDAAAGVGPVAAQTALSARGALGSWWLGAGAAAGWTDAPGVSTARGFVVVARAARSRPPPLDPDGDGFVGPADACPDAAGVGGAADGDGCPESPLAVAVDVRGFLDLPVLDAVVTLDVPAVWSPHATLGGEVTHPAYRPLSLPPIPLSRGPTTVVVALEPLPGQLLVTTADGLGRPVDARVALDPPAVPPLRTGADGRETVRLPPGAYALAIEAPGMVPAARRLVLGPGEPVAVDVPLHDAALAFVDGVLGLPAGALFVPAGDELSPEGRDRLAEVATLLRDHPELERVQVRVAVTGDDPVEASHRSQRRADNVAGWLYGQGVARARLEPRGLGAGADAVELRVVTAP